MEKIRILPVGKHKLGQFGAQPHFEVLFLAGLAPGDVRFVMTQLPLWVKGTCGRAVWTCALMFCFPFDSKKLC